MTAAIQINGLTKRYGEVLALDDINLRVERGDIYGFLGLNGAGKTTTIRAMLGMIRPTAGKVTLLGEPIRAGGRGPWDRVGHLVETPGLYPELTVRENLEIFRRMRGIPERRVIDRAIAQFGLDAYAERKAATLSLGNRQRLGLTRALFHRPDIVILDEPANGLDPAGVVEVRELLRTLCRERGMTIFMSSHALDEVDRLATRIGIIKAGKLIQDLDAAALQARRNQRLCIDTHDPAGARRALEAVGYTVRQGDGKQSLLLDQPHAIEAPDAVARALATADIFPTRLVIEQENLEKHFLDLMESPL